ncbi:MAG: SRPBCC family protein [Crocinitomicaceae bacterium]
MKKVANLLLSATFLLTTQISAQNLNSENGGFDENRIINGKKFKVVYNEVVIDKTVEEVWNEVALNFINIDKVMKSVNSTRCLSGDITYGLGTKRLCNLDNRGKTIEIKEEIIEYKDCGDHREFTYDVYDAPDVPLKNYATWIVRQGADGKTYLGSAFIFRANIGFLTGFIAKQIKKGGIRAGVLGYKHYLETGAKNVDPEKLLEMYPEK